MLPTCVSTHGRALARFPCLPAPPRRAAPAEDPLRVSAPADAQLLMTFRVSPIGVRAGPIKSLEFVQGGWVRMSGGLAAARPRPALGHWAA